MSNDLLMETSNQRNLSHPKAVSMITDFLSSVFPPRLGITLLKTRLIKKDNLKLYFKNEIQSKFKLLKAVININTA